MRDVYSNAYCSIGATGAMDNKDGLYLARDSIEAQFPVLDVESSKCVSRSYEAVCVLVLDIIWIEDNSSLLLNRAWVFQVRLMCRRMIRFSQDRVFLECIGGIYVGVPSDIDLRPVTLDNTSTRTATHTQGSLITTLPNSVNMKNCQHGEEEDGHLVYAGCRSLHCKCHHSS